LIKGLKTAEGWGGRQLPNTAAGKLHIAQASDTLPAVLKSHFLSIRNPQLIATAPAPLKERELTSSDQLMNCLSASKDIFIPRKRNKEQYPAESFIFLHINVVCGNASSSSFLKHVSHEAAPHRSCLSAVYISFKSSRKKKYGFSFLCASLNFSFNQEKRPFWVILVNMATSW